MGKHKKFLKSEKAKVKLKGTKLKAPQNATKTDFKVRKIVLTEQLKNVQKLESGERKTHNITDCIARLKNSTSPEVISNLRDIILYQSEDFLKHLEAIIKIVANLSLNIEKTVRKDGFKILETICSQTNEFTLRPFFPILLTYLKCAMTHIKPAIQEDSLQMFDILIRNAPKLVANERDKILPPYLDLMSKMRTEGNPERTLSFQLGNKITNMKWRRNVLERLIVYLKCINSQQGDENVHLKHTPANEINVDEKQEFLCNPHRKTATIEFGLSSLENFQESISKQGSTEQFSKYIHMIMPLMFETWMEMKPASESNISLIPQESALMLKVIMDIQIELFNMIEGNANLKQQFLKKYQDNFDKLIMFHFPYVQNPESGKRTQECGGERCIYQNLSIAIMYVNFSIKNPARFSKYREKCFDSIEQNILSWKNKDPEFNMLVKKLIRSLFTRESLKIFGSDSKRVFTALVRKCNVDQTTYDPKLQLVCEIFEKNEDLRHAETDNLLEQMVLVLAEREFIPVYLIETVSLLAKKGNKAIIETLEKKAMSIVTNLLGKLKISGNLDPAADVKWKMEVANLIYWVNSTEVLREIGEFTSARKDSISIKTNQIVVMKTN